MRAIAKSAKIHPAAKKFVAGKKLPYACLTYLYSLGVQMCHT